MKDVDLAKTLVCVDADAVVVGRIHNVSREGGWAFIRAYSR
jgi:hypothetical protein